VITTTLGKLIDAIPAVRALLKHPLGQQAAYDLSKLVRLIDQETPIFTERLTALRATFGLEKPTDVLRPDQMDAFQAAVTELTRVAVSIDWKPFDLSALPADAKVSGEDMLMLGVHDGAAALAVRPEPSQAPPASTTVSRGDKPRRKRR
jgi:hypothetical protein